MPDRDELLTFAQGATPKPPKPLISVIPCATCGALPAGEYPVGKTGDDARYYRCGPHPALKETR